MTRLALALAGLLLPGVAAAQEHFTQQFTHAQLKALDTPALARLMLGASGEQMIEHRIVIGDGGFGGAPLGSLESVSFAATPKFSTTGACVADSIRIGFTQAARTPQIDRPVRIWESKARQLWAILPAGAKDCSALGRMLDSPAAPGPYFQASAGGDQDLDPNAFAKAVAMLRGLLADPQTAIPLRCSIDFDGPDKRQGLCEARRFTEMFDIRRINMLQVGDCRFARPPAGETGTCVSFSFPEPSDSQGSGTFLQLTFVTDLPAGTRLTDTVRTVRIRISKVSWVA